MLPYPIEQLRRLTRERAREISDWARSGPIGGLATGGRGARDWLGTPIDVSLGPVREWDGGGLLEGAFVLLEGEPRAGLWLDPAIAGALVERTLGGEEDACPTLGPMGEVERGVLAYAVARWLGSGAWSVGTVLTSGPPLIEAVRPRARWSLALSLGVARGRGELWLGASDGLAPAPRRTPPGWLPIEVWIDGGRATLSAAEIAALGVGDVVIPEEPWIDAHGHGMVHLRAARSALTFVCRSDRALVVERVEEDAGSVEGRRGERSKGKTEMSDESIAKMGATPVTLHVEVARLEMTFGDIATLAVGEVVHTGRELGREVTLRAGDRAVARGELVDVDGELGVQITALCE